MTRTRQNWIVFGQSAANGHRNNRPRQPDQDNSPGGGNSLERAGAYMGEAMSRYRLIDVRMWGDAKFNRLSRPQPCGQFLWVYLLTGPHTTPIPGVFVAGEAALAEALGWSLKAFREAFGEAFREGMLRADFERRLVWIPRAILYNRPASPNVVRSWRNHWDELPECELKAEIWQGLKGSVEAFGEAFAEAFREALRQGFGESGTGTGTGTGNPPQSPPKGADQRGAKAKRYDPTTAPIPPALQTEAFRSAWLAWCADRADRRKPITEQGAAQQLRRLAAMGVVQAIASIEQSIASGWAGLFPPGKNGEQKQQTKCRALSDEEMEHGTYNGYTGFAYDTKTCKRPTCQRPQCVAARNGQ